MGTVHRRTWAAALQLCLDGEATPARVATVQRHLEECVDCVEEMELLACMKRSLARLGGSKSADPAVTRLRTHAGRFSA